MNIKFTELGFSTAKSHDLLKLECISCGNEFSAKKHHIKYALSGNGKAKLNNCSIKCFTGILEKKNVKCENVVLNFQKELVR